VLDEACRTAGEWDDGARVAVDISAEQFGRRADDARRDGQVGALARPA